MGVTIATRLPSNAAISRIFLIKQAPVPCEIAQFYLIRRLPDKPVTIMLLSGFPDDDIRKTHSIQETGRADFWRD
jgi:hypothetical protein